MRSLVIFIFSVLVFNTSMASIATTIKERPSCVVAPEETVNSVLGFIDYEKPSYKKYSDTINAQIAQLNLSLKAKHIEVEVSETECLENVLMGLSSISDIASQIEVSKDKKIILGSQSSSKDSFTALEISNENRELLRQYLLN